MPMLWLDHTRFVLPELTPPTDPPVRYMAEAGYELTPIDLSAAPFTEAILSWNADMPPGTALQADLRLRYGAADAPPEAADWSDWQTMGHWGRNVAAPDQRLPRSSSGGDAGLRHEIDVLRLDSGLEATAFAVRLHLSGGTTTPTVRRLAVSTIHRRRSLPPPAADPPLGRAVQLPVPARSQHAAPADLALHVCSPTSLGMVLQFYGHDQPTTQVAEAVFDHGAAIYGNWAFNVAYAGSCGLRAVVRHFTCLGDLERELQAGRPIVISIAFAAGELPESPTAGTAGHLLVVTGVTAAGDFLVNEPDADPTHGQAVARRYSRAGLRHVFLRHGGVAYVIEPDSASLGAGL